MLGVDYISECYAGIVIKIITLEYACPGDALASDIGYAGTLV